MSLVLLGLDHHSTPLSEREQLAYSQAAAEEAMSRLRNSHQFPNCLILATCNRLEIYAVTPKLPGAFQRLRSFLAADRDVDPDLINRRAYLLHDDSAVVHLFRVASGIESMVLGESQILGQLRASLAAARRAGALGSELEALGRHAVACARRARSETGIGRSPMSFAQATVTLAKREGPPLDKASVLIVGAGTMAGSVATWFAKAGCAELTIISRRFESAQVLARKHGSRAVPMTDLRMALESADVLVAAVDADEPILEADLIAERRSPLIAIDLGVPRAIASDFGGSPEIKTFDLDSLESIVSDAKSARSGQVQAVEAIIAEETERYLAWQRARQVAPTIAALQAAAEAIRVSELDRIHATMTDLSPAEEAALDSMTRSIVNKLLAQPIIRLKEHAQETHGLAYLDAVRNLFRLDSDSDEMASLDQAQG